MHTGKGQVVELILENGNRLARILCTPDLIPSPGQYLLAGIASQPDPLPVPLFSTESSSEGFIACAPIPENWAPGMEITLRGPMGSGFSLPDSAKKVALVPFDNVPSRLQGVMRNALKQGAAVVLVGESDEYTFPNEVEIQPFSALKDVLKWADYSAFDVARDNLTRFKQMLKDLIHVSVGGEAQILVRTPMPCGGIADCGVCVVTLRSNWKMVCKDGPVFDLGEI